MMRQCGWWLAVVVALMTGAAGVRHGASGDARHEWPLVHERLQANPAPLSLVVLVDVSAGTEVPVRALAGPLEADLLAALGPGDRVAFGRFGGLPTAVGRDFLSRPDELRQAARALLTPLVDPAGTPPKDAGLNARGLNGGFGLGASPAWDAVDEAVTVLEAQAGRRAVILLTDGRSTGNLRSLDEVIRRAVATRVAVYVVAEAVDEVIPQGRSTPEAHVRPTAALERLAAATGGACATVFGPEKGRPKRVDALAARRPLEREGGEPLKPAQVDERAFASWVGRLLAGFVNQLHGSRESTRDAAMSDRR